VRCPPRFAVWLWVGGTWRQSKSARDAGARVGAQRELASSAIREATELAHGVAIGDSRASATPCASGSRPLGPVPRLQRFRRVSRHCRTRAVSIIAGAGGDRRDAPGGTRPVRRLEHIWAGHASSPTRGARGAVRCAAAAARVEMFGFHWPRRRATTISCSCAVLPTLLGDPMEHRDRCRRLTHCAGCSSGEKQPDRLSQAHERSTCQGIATAARVGPTRRTTSSVYAGRTTSSPFWRGRWGVSRKMRMCAGRCAVSRPSGSDGGTNVMRELLAEPYYRHTRRAGHAADGYDRILDSNRTRGSRVALGAARRSVLSTAVARSGTISPFSRPRAPSAVARQDHERDLSAPRLGPGRFG